ncbi:MAG: UDP-N-acetylglucosamine 1-carboxyvinyltransferase [Candidatus Kerfeldbacteria bacterium]|nr:UDP-N-acetylglucosamine 1-carboxyvinyltransferase [Candidatus Kerfeldbacteria bacterium]
MAKFIIQGKGRIHGSIRVAGAKNHALKLFAAALLTKQPVRLTNVPEIEDVFRLGEILEAIGVSVQHKRKGEYHLTARQLTTTTLPKKLVPKLRASILLSGPVLARYGQVTFPHPGGCWFGKRPINLFIDAFTAMGATCTYQQGIYHCVAPKGGLRGTHYIFPIISVTGTETLMLAAVLARGTTTIENAAREPEVAALAEFLNSCGAHIRGVGTSTLMIRGVKQLHGGSSTVIPDRIETLSFIFLALAAKQKLTITHCQPNHIAVPLQLLRDSGALFTLTNQTITVHPWKKLKPLQVVTREYPGFPTDGQSPLTVLLTQIPGQSEVMETIYSDRLFYTDMLNRMGAHITMHTSQHIMIKGGTKLRAKIVDSPDLRAGIAMVIAGIIAHGRTEIGNIYQIDRGYEAIDQRLRAIGVRIERQDD